MTEKYDSTNSDKNFFWQFLTVIFKWRRLLILNSLAAAILTLAVMLFFPNWYTATTSIMPPEQDTGGLGLAASLLPSGLSSLLGSSGMTLPGMATPSDLYAAVLKSRIVSRAVIEKQDLYKVFDVHLAEKAYNELHARTAIAVEPEGIIVVSYSDTDPKRAADVANTFIDELNRVNQENIVSKARAMREFIEQRLTETIRDLTDAEEAYKNFQQIHFAVSLDDQVKAMINAIAELRGQLAVAEIELGVMRKSLSPTNMRYQEQEYKIEQIRDQLSKIELGDTTQSSLLNMPMKETPELALDLVRLTRNLKIQETIFELLKQQYEQAKIQELKDTPTIQVLDKAEVPRIKSRPKRVFTAAVGGVACFGLTMLFIIYLEFYRREKALNSASYQRLQSISQMINEDYYWMRNIFSRKRKNGN